MIHHFSYKIQILLKNLSNFVQEMIENVNIVDDTWKKQVYALIHVCIIFTAMFIAIEI